MLSSEDPGRSVCQPSLCVQHELSVSRAGLVICTRETVFDLTVPEGRYWQVRECFAGNATQNLSHPHNERLALHLALLEAEV